MIGEIVLSGTQKLVFHALLAVPGILVWTWLVRRLRERGGRVDASPFGLPDLLLSFFLCGFFALLPLQSWFASEKPVAAPTAEVQVTPESQILGSMLIFLGFVAVIWVSLLARKVSPGRIFGLKRMSPARGFLIGALILFALFPLLGAVGSVAYEFLKETAKEQEVVTYFRKMQEDGKTGSIWLIVFSAVIFQPVVEEFLFRGYFYAVFKGWAGPVASAVFTATLFATIHVNMVALLPLLIFAFVLTLAYEWSGSLWVPISMHVIFNGSQLAIMTLWPNLGPQ